MEDQFRTALQSPRPTESLTAVARRLLDKGHPREEIIGALKDLHLKLVETDRECEIDAVVDVLDALTGWCSPHTRM